MARLPAPIKDRLLGSDARHVGSEVTAVSIPRDDDRDHPRGLLASNPDRDTSNWGDPPRPGSPSHNRLLDAEHSLSTQRSTALRIAIEDPRYLSRRKVRQGIDYYSQ